MFAATFRHRGIIQYVTSSIKINASVVCIKSAPDGYFPFARCACFPMHPLLFLLTFLSLPTFA